MQSDELVKENARLQAEVERLNGMLDASSELFRTKQRVNRDLQSELTKARELLRKAVEDSGGYLPGVSEFLANQSVPADKGQGEPVARDQQVTELAEFMGRLSGGLRHFAGQIIDAGWKKRSEWITANPRAGSGGDA